jgi:hypothetical protein
MTGCERRKDCPLYECCAAIGKARPLGNLIQEWKAAARRGGAGDPTNGAPGPSPPARRPGRQP